MLTNQFLHATPGLGIALSAFDIYLVGKSGYSKIYAPSYSQSYLLTLTEFRVFEWLIYSTWFVGDNLSSLMQSVGASEKVFQMMDLAPSQQFTSKGSKFPNLKGRIKFVNVSFSYTSRETARREKINARMKFLQELVPRCNKLKGRRGMIVRVSSGKEATY